MSPSRCLAGEMVGNCAGSLGSCAGSVSSSRVGTWEAVGRVKEGDGGHVEEEEEPVPKKSR